MSFSTDKSRGKKILVPKPALTPEQKALIAEAIAQRARRTLPDDRYDHPGDPLHGAPMTRRASGLLEAVCEHGCGHPIDESIAWLDAFGPPGARGTWGVHGCCGSGCCRRTEAQDLVEECRWSAARAELSSGADWIPSDG